MVLPSAIEEKWDEEEEEEEESDSGGAGCTTLLEVFRPHTCAAGLASHSGSVSFALVGIVVRISAAPRPIGCREVKKDCMGRPSTTRRRGPG